MSTLADIAREEYKMEMTPMIDVTFLLLIFFLCTIKFKTLEGKLSAYLPKDVGVNTSSAEPIEKVEILIKVTNVGRKVVLNPDGSIKGDWDGEGRFDYVGRELLYAIGPRKTTDLAEIRSRLKDLHKADPERPATIDARKNTIYGDIVPVLDAALEAEFTEITFVGEYK
jgi:biopolymer transport protein ExbD